MDRIKLLDEMRASIGTQAPTVFFEKMTDLFELMFDHIEGLELSNRRLKSLVPLAIQWEPKVAASMLAQEIDSLKQSDKDAYAVEIQALKIAYAEDRVTQEYADFCKFWQDTLGYHPFLSYDK
jgi:hypothetical protein